MAYINCKVEEVEGARVGLPALFILHLAANLGDFVLQTASTQLAHQPGRMLG